MKWQVDENTNGLNGKLMKRQVDEMAGWKKWQIGEMESRHNSWLIK
jgi:hypothetical protein